MSRRIAIGVMWALAGYVVGAFGGGMLIAAISTNHFDLQMEEVMTGAFVTGPIMAVAAFIAGFIRAGRRRASAARPT